MKSIFFRSHPRLFETDAGSSGARAPGACWFALLVLCAASLLLVGAARAGLGPLVVVGVGRATSVQGPAVATDRALRQAVKIVVRRYVPPAAYDHNQKWISRRIVGRPRRYVLRYAIGTERWVDAGNEAEVEVTVDRARLLSDLAAGGVGFHRLAAWPRLLLVTAQGDPLGRVVAEELRGQGALVRTLVLPTERRDGPEAWAVDARDLGCHLVVALAGETEVEEVEPEDLFSRESVRPGASARGTAWVIDARTLKRYGEIDADASVEAPTAVEAAAFARTRAARGLAYRVVARVEQSDWTPGNRVAQVDLVVTGLPDARALGEVGVSLKGLAEVETARLREIGHRSGRWRLEVSDPDVNWEAVLSSVVPARGHLSWYGEADGTGPVETATVEARWTP